MRPPAWFALLAPLLAAVPREARGQDETRAAVAEGLYRQARDLMVSGQVNEACVKFAESQRLDPATGTLLNLAACHERQGRLATAWLEYADAIAAARRDGREDRVEFAQKRVAELEPKLSRLTIMLAPDAEPAGLTLELDGASVGSAVLGTPTPMDPGEHRVRVSAPGKLPRELTVNIGPGPDERRLTISRLDDAPSTPAPGNAPPLALSLAPPVTSPTVPLARDPVTQRPIPTALYVAGGVTLALVAGAGVTGLAYLNERHDYDNQRTSDHRNEALTYGRINLALWVGAAVGAGVTTYLYATRPTLRVAVRAVPMVAPQVAGLAFTGGF